MSPAARARLSRDGAALVAGALLPLAFAPFGLWPLAILSLGVLYLVWQTDSPGRAAWRGWLFGLGMFGVGVSWVQISIHQFGLPLLLFSVSVTVVFVAFLSLYPALVGYLSRRRLHLPRAPGLLLVLPALWTATEWIRGWLLTGFPWLNLGNSQIDAPLSGLAPLGGVYLVSWAVAATAGAVALIALGDRRWWLTLGLPGVLWVGSAAVAGVPWTQPHGEPLRVALIQGNVPQPIKWEAAERQRTLDLYWSLSETHWDRDLLVWPETAIPAFPQQVETFMRRLHDQALSSRADLLAGIPWYEVDSQAYYNSVVSLGTTPGVYHKRHLVPFGEYLPLERLLGGVLRFLDVPMSSFSPGAERPLLTAAGQPVGLSICYEDVFGEQVIDALPEATLLVNVSNDAWFGDSIAPHQHLEIARFRALETGRWLLRATNTGISALIDHRGAIAARSPQFRADALTGEVQPRTGLTPYARFGNFPVLAALVLALASALSLDRRRPGAVG